MTIQETVVNFADMVFKLRSRRAFPADECKHPHVILDDEGGIVECADCHKPLDAYITLRRMCDKWSQHAQHVQRAVDKLNQDSKAILTLRAAKLVESAWRHRGSVPTCPHCRAAIFPEDGLGTSYVSKEIELRRRKSNADMATQNTPRSP